MVSESLKESIARHIENPREAKANDLRDNGLLKFSICTSITKLGEKILVLGLTVGAAAVAGEVMDHIPYVSTAIPEAIRALTNSEYFYGNLDKLAAAACFVGYCLKKA